MIIDMQDCPICHTPMAVEPCLACQLAAKEAELEQVRRERMDWTEVASDWKLIADKNADMLNIERKRADDNEKALALACNKMFREGIIIETDDPDEPAIQPRPDYFRNEVRKGQKEGK